MSSKCGWQIPTQFICQLMVCFPNHSLCVSRKVLGKYIMVQSAITCINTSCDFNFSRKFLLHKSWLRILIKRSHTQKLSLLKPISHINFFSFADVWKVYTVHMFDGQSKKIGQVYVFIPQRHKASELDMAQKLRKEILALFCHSFIHNLFLVFINKL